MRYTKADKRGTGDTTESVSFWKVFRVIFVIFSLFLMGDAFYRWNGFRYYASFFEFIPAFALISILWSVIAVLFAIFVLFLTRSLKWSFSKMGIIIRAENLLLFNCYLILMLVGYFTLEGKRIWIAEINIFSGATVLIVFLCSILIISALLTWLTRNHFKGIQERITPLVYLFSFILLVSFPIVSYHTWIKKPEKAETWLSPSYGEKESRPNIILVTFDALSALDMSAYGYYRETTPFIKEWAKKSTFFERAYTAGTTTTTTTASLMSGKNLWTHLRYNQVHAGDLERGAVENIAYELKNKGYYNYAIVTNENASVTVRGMNDSFYYHVPWIELFEPTNVSELIRKWLYNTFGENIRLYEWLVMPDFALDRILTKIKVGRSELEFPPETVINKLSLLIDNKLKEPYFIWIHFHPPHYPYTPPKEFKGIYNNSSIMIRKKDQGNFFLEYYKKELGTESIIKSLAVLRSRYDEHIRYCDKIFESVIDLLNSKNQLKNSTIILSADHGESFRNGMIEHGSVLYEQVTHIPLIIREPGQNSGSIIEMPVHQTDISATILDLANIPVPAWIEGRSLVPLMHGNKLPQRPLFSMWLSPNPSGQKISRGRIATWEDDYKLIYDLTEDKSLLFNLRKDPEETDNLINSEPEVGNHLLDLIKTNLAKANEKFVAENN